MTKATKAAPEATEAQTEAPEAIVRRSKVPLAYQQKYAASTLRGTCDDALAHAMAATKTGDQRAALYALAEANGIDAKGRWGERNIGMLRMNLGNVLRHAAKRGIPTKGL